METILKTVELSKRFGKKVAVDKVNINIARGDIYGFIGKNGAGKTTAMRMIVGTEFATSGSIELFGGTPLSQARRKIGSLLEKPGIYNGCSARENLKRFAILYNAPDSQIDEILTLVGLSDTGKKKAGAFSLGMKQRLGIGIALLGNPEFIVLDEPVNGLDPEGIKTIRDLVLRLNREKGITFLISSHLLDELAKIVTKYGIINDGVLVEEISASELEKRTFDGLKVVVNDVEKAKSVLLNYAPEDKLQINGATIILTENYDDAAGINKALVEAGVNVSELVHHANALDEYFIERMGK